MSLPLLISLFGVIAVISVLGLLYLHKSDRTASNNTDELAKKLGLTFDKGSLTSEPSLKGTYDGIPVVVQSIVTGSGTALIYNTMYTVTVNGPHIPLDLVVYREGWASRIGKAFGGEDIQLDDSELDKAFIIKGSSQNDARLFFARPNVKSCFLNMSSEGDNFRLENQTLAIELPHRLIEETERLQSHIDRLVAYAKTIKQSTGNYTNFQPDDPTDLLGESTTLEVFMPHKTDVVT